MTLNVTTPDGHLITLKELERRMVKLALYQYSQREAARRLGIGRETLRRRYGNFYESESCGFRPESGLTMTGLQCTLPDSRG